LRSPGTGGAAGGGAAEVGGDETGEGNSGAAPSAGEGAASEGALSGDPEGKAGAAAFVGGSFSGPLMPHETIANAASETTRVVAKRRNIRLS
jgi:hypothetical protein